MRTVSKKQALASLNEVIESRPKPPFGGSIANRNTFGTWHGKAVWVAQQVLGNADGLVKEMADAFAPVADWSNTDQEKVLGDASARILVTLNAAVAAVEKWDSPPRAGDPGDIDAAARAIFRVLVTRYKATANSNAMCEVGDPLWAEMGISRNDARMAFDALEATPLVRTPMAAAISLASPVGIRAALQPTVLDTYFPVPGPGDEETSSVPDGRFEDEDPMNPIKIFVSHDSHDADLAEKLVDFLKIAIDVEDEQIRCTSVIGHKLEGGDDTRGRLRDDIRACAVFLCLVTPLSVDSDWVLLELGAIWALNKRAIPIVAHGATFKVLPPVFGLTHALKASDETDMADMIKTVCKHTQLTAKDASGKFQAQLRKLVDVASAKKTSVAEPKAVAPVSATPPTSMADDDAIMLLRDVLDEMASEPGDPSSLEYKWFDERAKVPAGSAQRLLKEAVKGTHWTVVSGSTSRIRLAFRPIVQER